MKTSYDYSNTLYPGHSLPWLMSHAERSALLHLLELTRPSAAIEVGTCHGGCLEQIRRRADFVYSIDINPEVAAKLAPGMPNVDFLTGDSKEMIGCALDKCMQRNQHLGFALIDGDHSYAAVQNDIHALLAYRPKRPLWVLMHDSGNPECRRGIAEARWSGNPHVHMVDLDFVTGGISEDIEFERQIWGGLGIALLLPELRQGDLCVAASASKNQAALLKASDHYPSALRRAMRWLRVKRKGLDRRLDRIPILRRSRLQKNSSDSK